ncbi:MAG: hypothetical protein ACKO5K_11265 [Armatimonadota bacterium]
MPSRLPGHLWNAPNTGIGLVMAVGGRPRFDRENGVLVVRGGWMAWIFGHLGYAGMCVGDVVLEAMPLDPATYRHELAHADQGRLLGPFYLPCTLLGYAIGFLRCPRLAHDASPMEIDADRRSGNADRNEWLARSRGG